MVTQAFFAGQPAALGPDGDNSLQVPILCQCRGSELRLAVEAISAATSAVLWEYLRRSRGNSIPRARAVMKRTVASILRDLPG